VEGEAKKKYAYHQPPAAGDVLSLAYDPKKKEVGVQLHPNFTGVDRQTLYKADVVIEEARPQFDPALLQDLQWTDARGFQVPSLADQPHRSPLPHQPQRPGGVYVLRGVVLREERGVRSGEERLRSVPYPIKQAFEQ
jgi:hypothetical protein